MEKFSPKRVMLFHKNSQEDNSKYTKALTQLHRGSTNMEHSPLESNSTDTLLTFNLSTFWRRV
jgi:hypothetical protein